MKQRKHAEVKNQHIRTHQQSFMWICTYWMGTNRIEWKQKKLNYTVLSFICVCHFHVLSDVNACVSLTIAKRKQFSRWPRYDYKTIYKNTISVRSIRARAHHLPTPADGDCDAEISCRVIIVSYPWHSVNIYRAYRPTIWVLCFNILTVELFSFNQIWFERSFAYRLDMSWVRVLLCVSSISWP